MQNLNYSNSNLNLSFSSFTKGYSSMIFKYCCFLFNVISPFNSSLTQTLLGKSIPHLFFVSWELTLNNIENEHADFVNEPEHILVTEKMFYDYIQNGFISKFKITDLNKLETYIKDNVSKYAVQ